MSDAELPGLSIVLVDDQDVVWMETYGVSDLEGNVPVTDDTVWRVGSITKLITAIEVMRLEQDGLVDLDAPLTDAMPDFSVRQRDLDAAPITLRSMLSHRSGVPRNSGLPSWYWDAGIDVMQAQAAELALFYAAFPPGDRFHYSNAAFEVMAALVERERGLWVPYAEAQLRGPLGMAGSALLFQDLDEGAEVAQSYNWDGDQHVPNERGDLIELASGNLFATIPDLAALIRFFHAEGQIGDVPVLASESVRRMFEVQPTQPRDPKTMGLAWQVSEDRLPEALVLHTGTMDGTETMVALLPQSKVGVAVVANSTRFKDLYGELTVEALELMLETKTGTLPTERPDPDLVDIGEDTLDTYAGRYVCDDALVPVWRKGGKLKVEQEGVKLALRPVGPDRFVVHHWLGDPGEIEVRFFVGDPDEQDILVAHIERMETVICPRYPDVDRVPPLWREIEGRYRIVPRVPSVTYDVDVLGSVEAVIEDGALRLGRLWVWPKNPSELIVIGGPWDGETVQRDPETGVLTFQYELNEPV